MIDLIKRKLVRFLGLSDVEKRCKQAENSAESAQHYAKTMKALLEKHLAVAVDVSRFAKGNTMVVVASDLNGGHVDVIWVNAKDIRELRDITRRMACWVEPKMIVDAPKYILEMWDKS